MNETATPSKRLPDLDAFRGILIVLVVFGHITLHSIPYGNDWYLLTRTLVYQFHMPAFLFISGFVFFLSGSAHIEWRKYGSYVAGRAERLLIPYFAMVVIIIGGKLFASLFLPVDHLPANLVEGLLATFGSNAESPVNSLWYLMVLFIYCAITPPLMSAFKGRLELIAALAFLATFIPAPQEFYIWRTSHFFIFFLCGAIAGKNMNAYFLFIDRYRIPLIAISVAVLGWAIFYPRLSFTMVLVSLFVIPAIHSICRLEKVYGLRLLQLLSRYSMIIYLLNSVCSGLLKGAILKYSSWDDEAFYFWAPVMVVFGLAAPILCKAFVLDRIPYLRRLTS